MIYIMLSCLSLVSCIGYASDTQSTYKETVVAGNFYAKKYVLNKNVTDYKSASSDSFFVGENRDNKSEILVFDRKHGYKHHITLQSHFDLNSYRDPKMAIIQDEYLMSAHKDTDGLWIDKIGTTSSSKNIKLKQDETFQKHGWSHPINHLHAVPKQSNVVSFEHRDAVFLDITTEQIISTFSCPANQSSILTVIPNSCGTGIFYRTGKVSEKVGSIGHYDMRSKDNTLFEAELPFDITPLSANGDNSRCMVQSARRLVIYDVKTGKKEFPMYLLDDKKEVKTALFADNDTILFATENTKEKEYALHSMALSSGDVKTSQLKDDVCGISHHHDSRLLFETDLWGNIKVVYDVGFTQ